MGFQQIRAPPAGACCGIAATSGDHDDVVFGERPRPGSAQPLGSGHAKVAIGKSNLTRFGQAQAIGDAEDWASNAPDVIADGSRRREQDMHLDETSSQRQRPVAGAGNGAGMLPATDRRPALARPPWRGCLPADHRRLPHERRCTQASLPDTCPSIFEVWYSAMPRRLIRPSCCSSHQAWSSSVSCNCLSSTSRLT